MSTENTSMKVVAESKSYPLLTVYWIQVFFHYVDADGPLASYKFDGRPGIGYPPE